MIKDNPWFMTPKVAHFILHLEDGMCSTDIRKLSDIAYCNVYFIKKRLIDKGFIKTKKKGVKSLMFLTVTGWKLKNLVCNLWELSKQK